MIIPNWIDDVFSVINNGTALDIKTSNLSDTKLEVLVRSLERRKNDLRQTSNQEPYSSSLAPLRIESKVREYILCLAGIALIEKERHSRMTHEEQEICKPFYGMSPSYLQNFSRNGELKRVTLADSSVNDDVTVDIKLVHIDGEHFDECAQDLNDFEILSILRQIEQDYKSIYDMQDFQEGKPRNLWDFMVLAVFFVTSALRGADQQRLSVLNEIGFSLSILEMISLTPARIATYEMYLIHRTQAFAITEQRNYYHRYYSPMKLAFTKNPHFLEIYTDNSYSLWSIYNRDYLLWLKPKINDLNISNQDFTTCDSNYFHLRLTNCIIDNFEVQDLYSHPEDDLWFFVPEVSKSKKKKKKTIPRVPLGPKNTQRGFSSGNFDTTSYSNCMLVPMKKGGKVIFQPWRGYTKSFNVSYYAPWWSNTSNEAGTDTRLPKWSYPYIYIKPNTDNPSESTIGFHFSENKIGLESQKEYFNAVKTELFEKYSSITDWSQIKRSTLEHYARSYILCNVALGIIIQKLNNNGIHRQHWIPELYLKKFAKDGRINRVTKINGKNSWTNPKDVDFMEPVNDFGKMYPPQYEVILSRFETDYGHLTKQRFSQDKTEQTTNTVVSNLWEFLVLTTFFLIFELRTKQQHDAKHPGWDKQLSLLLSFAPDAISNLEVFQMNFRSEFIWDKPNEETETWTSGLPFTQHPIYKDFEVMEDNEIIVSYWAINAPNMLLWFRHKKSNHKLTTTQQFVMSKIYGILGTSKTTVLYFHPDDNPWILREIKK